MVEGVSNRLLILTGLAIVIGIIGSFVIFAGLMYSFKSLGLFFYVFAALAIFSALAAYSLYVGFRRRKWTALALMFTILGVFLLASSTVAALPYSTVQTYPTQFSHTIFNEMFSIGPNETRIFEQHTYPRASTNSSLVQIRITQASEEQALLDVQFFTWANWEGERWSPQLIPVLNFTYYGHGRLLGLGWRSYYWTPAGPMVESYGVPPIDWSDVSNYAVVFHNHDNSSSQVQMQTDIFYKTDGHVETVEYRPLIDFQFAYAGIGLIGIALFAEGYPQLRRKNNVVTDSHSANRP